MARGQNEPTLSLDVPDKRAHRGGGQESVLPRDHLANAVGGADLNDLLHHDIVIEPPIAAHHERLTRERLQPGSLQRALHKILHVVLLLEHRGLLAEATRAGLLALKRAALHAHADHPAHSPGPHPCRTRSGTTKVKLGKVRLRRPRLYLSQNETLWFRLSGWLGKALAWLLC